MYEIRLFKFSLFVRLFVIFLQVIFNRCVPDHNADAFQLPCEKEPGTVNVITFYLLEGFSRWDAQYFLHIALYGYTHENTLAFFPLFPMSLRAAAWTMSLAIPFGFGHVNITLLSGVILNMFLSSLAAVFLYKLTRAVLQSELLAFTSALLFCINPASVFFSALYSESLFSLLSFFGLWALERDNGILALVSLSLSASVRSNGILSVGFLAYAILKRHARFHLSARHVPIRLSLFLCFFTVLKIIICLLLFSLSFLAYQTYCYVLFCTSLFDEQDMPEIVMDFVTRNDLKIPSEPSKWCFWNIPFSYSYIQSRYWDVGFLHYYSVKQIPNFLLAAPVFVVIFLSSIKFFKRNSVKLWHVGLLERDVRGTYDIYSCVKCFPYFIHVFLATISCALFIHIQVLTRMLCSSSPVLYWVAASALLPSRDRAQFKLLKECSHNNWVVDNLHFMKKAFLKSSIQGKVIFCYFVTYFFIGAFLHVNFFPWT